MEWNGGMEWNGVTTPSEQWCARVGYHTAGNFRALLIFVVDLAVIKFFHPRKLNAYDDNGYPSTSPYDGRGHNIVAAQRGQHFRKQQ